MRKLILLAGVAALAACAEAEAPEDTEAMEEATVAEAPAIEPGLFEVTSADGEVGQTRLNADGTYVDIVDGEQIGSGTWVQRDGQMCFDGDAEGEEEACWTDGPMNEDGSWTATGPDGTTVTVRRVDETA